MNILVTGGAGYIGSATAEALIEAGHQVTVYDSLVTVHRAAIPADAIFIHADLADTHSLRRPWQIKSSTRSCILQPSSRPVKAWWSPDAFIKTISPTRWD